MGKNTIIGIVDSKWNLVKTDQMIIDFKERIRSMDAASFGISLSLYETYKKWLPSRGIFVFGKSEEWNPHIIRVDYIEEFFNMRKTDRPMLLWLDASDIKKAIPFVNSMYLCRFMEEIGGEPFPLDYVKPHFSNRDISEGNWEEMATYTEVKPERRETIISDTMTLVQNIAAKEAKPGCNNWRFESYS